MKKKIMYLIFGLWFLIGSSSVFAMRWVNPHHKGENRHRSSRSNMLNIGVGKGRVEGKNITRELEKIEEDIMRKDIFEEKDREYKTKKAKKERKIGKKSFEILQNLGIKTSGGWGFDFKSFIESQKKFWELQIERKKSQKEINILEKDRKVREKAKKNKKTREKVEKAEKEGLILSLLNEFTSKPAIDDNIKVYAEKKLKNLNNEVVKIVDKSIITKLGGENTIKSFSLSGNFNPTKVVTFKDIKLLAISNLTLYKNLLDCEDPDDAVLDLCDGITNLLEDLIVDDKKLTINDIYKLQVYQSTIARAIFYMGTLKEFKRGAIVLGVDKKTNRLKSLDVVRSYNPVYNNDNDTDILEVKAKEVKVYNTYIKPNMEGNNIKIVLGLRNGSVIGLKLYPLDKGSYIPYASMYKVMEINGLIKGCENNNYKESIWYGYNQIGISHNRYNLSPIGTKGIKFNFDEGCYDTFDNTQKQTTSVVKKLPVNSSLIPLYNGIWRLKSNYYVVDGSIIKSGCNDPRVPNRNNCILKLGNTYISPASLEKKLNHDAGLSYCRSLNIGLPGVVSLLPSYSDLMLIKANVSKLYGLKKYYYISSTLVNGKSRVWKGRRHGLKYSIPTDIHSTARGQIRCVFKKIMAK